jgi:hypothetical protein
VATPRASSSRQFSPSHDSASPWLSDSGMSTPSEAGSISPPAGSSSRQCQVMVREASEPAGRRRPPGPLASVARLPRCRDVPVAAM